MTRTQVEALIDERKAKGLTLKFPFQFFGARARAKELGALWCPDDKVWCFATEADLQDVRERCGDKAERIGDPSGQQEMDFKPEGKDRVLEATRRERDALRAEVKRLTDENALLRGERDEARASAKSLPSVQGSPLATGLVIERAAKFGANAVEKALLVALRAQLAGEDADKARARVEDSLVAGPRMIDMDEAPGIARPLGVEAPEGSQDAMPEDLEDPDAGAPEGASHVTGTCRACGKFGMVRTHVRLHDECAKDEAFVDSFLKTKEGRKFDAATKALAAAPAKASPGPQDRSAPPAPAPGPAPSPPRASRSARHARPS